MQSRNINLGQIGFTNSLPLNYSFYKWQLDDIKIHSGCPSEINRMIKDGIVDVASISSIEYINNQEKYTLLDNVCISSFGEVSSVILFSNYEMQDLSNKHIAVPHTSATSIALLKILFSENNADTDSIKFSVHRYETSLDESLTNKYDAILYIGDPALCANIQYKDKYLIHDFGECWFKMTNLPMVFSTWVARSAWVKANNDEFIKIKSLLDKAVESGLSMYFNEIINLASNNLKLDKFIIEDYLTDKIRYSFTEDHRNSLMLFEKLYNNLNKRAEII